MKLLEIAEAASKGLKYLLLSGKSLSEKTPNQWVATNNNHKTEIADSTFVSMEFQKQEWSKYLS